MEMIDPMQGAAVIQSVPATVTTPPPIHLECKKCHHEIKAEFFFCPNCGYKLKQPPMSTSIGSQIKYYLYSVILFPFGIVWGIRYLRDERTSAKLIGTALILITIIMAMMVAMWTVEITNQVSTQINEQMRIINGGY